MEVFSTYTVDIVHLSQICIIYLLNQALKQQKQCIQINGNISEYYLFLVNSPFSVSQWNKKQTFNHQKSH